MWGDSAIENVTIFVGPLTAIQQTFDINFPWLRSGLPEETIYFAPVFYVQATYGAKEYQTCTDTALSGYQFRGSEIHFQCPEKFTLCQRRIRTKDLSICIRTSYH